MATLYLEDAHLISHPIGIDMHNLTLSILHGTHRLVSDYYDAYLHMYMDLHPTI